MKEQINNQIEKLKKQLDAVTGPKDIGSSIGSVAAQLPAKWQSIYNTMGNSD